MEACFGGDLCDYLGDRVRHRILFDLDFIAFVSSFIRMILRLPRDTCFVIQRRNKNPLSEKDIAVILRQILDGLKYLHHHNWGHFDLKPGMLTMICLIVVSVVT